MVRPAWASAAAEAPRSPLIVEANRIARVHRRAPLDPSIVPVMAGGEATAPSVHAWGWKPAPRWPPRRTASRACAASSRR